MTRLLVVDDEPHLRELLTLTLTLRGFDVYAAPDGLHALQVARRERFDVALLDVSMTPMDGFTLAQALRELPDRPRILFLTGLTDQVTMQRGAELGEGFLTKPFRPADLIEAIRLVLGNPPTTGTTT